MATAIAFTGGALTPSLVDDITCEPSVAEGVDVTVQTGLGVITAKRRFRGIGEIRSGNGRELARDLN